MKRTVLSVAVVKLLFLTGTSTILGRQTVPSLAWALLLDQTAAYYESRYPYRVTFQCEVQHPPASAEEGEDERRQTEKYTGVMVVKGKAYRLLLPIYEVITDGKILGVRWINNKEIHINTYNPNQEELNLIDLLALHRKGYFLQGVYEKGGTDILPKIYVVTMVPAEETPDAQYLQHITLEIAYASKELLGWSMVYLDGTCSTFRITQFEPRLELPADYFSLNAYVKKYEDVEVIDLR